MIQRDRQHQVMHPDWLDTVFRTHDNIMVSHRGVCCMQLQVWLIPRVWKLSKMSCKALTWVLSFFCSQSFTDSMRFSTESILQSMDCLIWTFHKSSCLKVFLLVGIQYFRYSRKSENSKIELNHEPRDHALSTRTGSKAFLLPPQICAGSNCREPETLSGKQTLWRDL